MMEFIPYLITAGIYLLVAADYWRMRKPAATEVRWQWLFTLIAIGLAFHGCCSAKPCSKAASTWG